MPNLPPPALADLIPGDNPFLNPIPEISFPLPDFIAPVAAIELLLARQPAVELPLARQPFDRNWPIHYMGKMDVLCPHCGALHWMAERLSKSSQIHPKIGRAHV